MRGRIAPYKRIIVQLLLVIFFLLPASMSQAGEPGRLFSTGNIMELDRVASAWLIKRYVAPDAHFKFFPEGQLIDQGIAFDTPDAGLQRTHRFATFEAIKQRYGISDPKLDTLTRIIHDAEINFWAADRVPAAEALVQKINQAIKSSRDTSACLIQCFVIFDEFTQRI